jgi:hypothetical protein
LGKRAAICLTRSGNCDILTTLVEEDVQMKRDEAQQAAEELAAILQAKLGGEWEPEVWENRGWHYRVRHGKWLKVHPVGDGRFHALIGQHGGLGMWIGRLYSEDPVEVVAHQVACAQEEINRLQTMLDEATPPVLAGQDPSLIKINEQFLTKILRHSFAQGEFAAFGRLATNIGGKENRQVAIDEMLTATIEENKRNAKGLVALAKREGAK